jgi:acyl-coenzyme A synthetase/AMP-(fatty) acid ligase
VDKDSLRAAESLEVDIPIVCFENVLEFKDDCCTFAFEDISEEEKSKEMELPAYCLHTSGSTGHPKLIPQVRYKNASCSTHTRLK